MKIVKVKKVLTIFLTVVLVLSGISACSIEKNSNESVPDAKELVRKYVDFNKKLGGFTNSNGYDIAELFKRVLSDSNKSTSTISVDWDMPFDYKSNYLNFNGKLTLNADASIANIGKSNSGKLGQHNLIKIKCDYKYSFGASFFPSVFSLNGNIICYIAISDNGDTISGYYKLSDFDKNWYSFRVSDINNALELYKEMEEQRQKDFDELKKKALEDESVDEETKSYLNRIETDPKEISRKLYDHYYGNFIDSAKMTNKSIDVKESNVKGAHEVKCDINIIDDYMIDFIYSYIPESQLEEFKKINIEQLKNKLIIHETLYFAKDQNVPINFDGYGLVKEVVDMKDFSIDFTFEDVIFKLYFNKGISSNIMKSGSESDSVPDEIIENAISVGEYKLTDALGNINSLINYT